MTTPRQDFQKTMVLSNNERLQKTVAKWKRAAKKWEELFHTVCEDNLIDPDEYVGEK